MFWGDTDFLVNMSASADVLAQAKVEIDLAAIPEGKNVSTFQKRGSHSEFCGPSGTKERDYADDNAFYDRLSSNGEVRLTTQFNISSAPFSILNSFPATLCPPLHSPLSLSQKRRLPHPDPLILTLISFQESPSSSVTAPPAKSPKPNPPTSPSCATPNPTPTASSGPNG